MKTIWSVVVIFTLNVVHVLADVSPQEQLVIYELNRTRNDPARYQSENSGIVTADLSSVVAQMPLAINSNLTEAAGFRATEMVQSNYCAHQSAVTGLWPNRIARDFGYPLPVLYADDSNQIESIFCESGPVSLTNTVAEDGLAALIDDDGLSPPGHRIQLLATDPFFQDNREIGVGIASVPETIGGHAGARSRLAIHTSQEDASQRFLTGVLYNDANGNFRYDLNEGLGGVTISIGATNIQTLAAGGWAIRVAPATYTVVASGGGFSGTATAQVVVSSRNVEIDFSSGNSVGEVDFSNQVAHANLAITKTASLDPATVTEPLAYTVKVSNTGPQAATSVTVTDTLPAAVQFVNVSASQGNCQIAGSTVACDLGTIAKNGSATITINVTPSATGQVCNVALASTTAADPNLSNNTVTNCITVNPPVHDLAVSVLKAPKKITLKEGVTPKPGKVQVTIRNLSPHTETIDDLPTLAALVALNVESLGVCPAPTTTLVPPKVLPVNLAPNKSLKLTYTVAIDCANDPLANTKTDPGHQDYRFSVTVNHAALDGNTDTSPGNDVCPRDPSGSDKGCGAKKPDKTLGGDVLTDVVVK